MSFLNLSGVKDDSNNDYGPMPEGKYLMHCSKAEVKNTKAGTGRYIKCEFIVDEGEFQNRKVWHNFNIENPSTVAQQIGLSQLKSFLTHSSYHSPEELMSLEDLVGLKTNAKLKIRRSEQYGDSNEISSFSEIAKDDSEQVPF